MPVEGPVGGAGAGGGAGGGAAAGGAGGVGGTGHGAGAAAVGTANQPGGSSDGMAAMTAMLLNMTASCAESAAFADGVATGPGPEGVPGDLPPDSGNTDDSPGSGKNSGGNSGGNSRGDSGSSSDDSGYNFSQSAEGTGGYVAELMEKADESSYVMAENAQTLSISGIQMALSSAEGQMNDTVSSAKQEKNATIEAADAAIAGAVISGTAAGASVGYSTLKAPVDETAGFNTTQKALENNPEPPPPVTHTTSPVGDTSLSKGTAPTDIATTPNSVPIQKTDPADRSSPSISNKTAGSPATADQVNSTTNAGQQVPADQQVNAITPPASGSPTANAGQQVPADQQVNAITPTASGSPTATAVPGSSTETQISATVSKDSESAKNANAATTTTQDLTSDQNPTSSVNTFKEGSDGQAGDGKGGRGQDQPGNPASNGVGQPNEATLTPDQTTLLQRGKLTGDNVEQRTADAITGKNGNRPLNTAERGQVSNSSREGMRIAQDTMNANMQKVTMKSQAIEQIGNSLGTMATQAGAVAAATQTANAKEIGALATMMGFSLSTNQQIQALGVASLQAAASLVSSAMSMVSSAQIKNS